MHNLKLSAKQTLNAKCQHVCRYIDKRGSAYVALLFRIDMTTMFTKILSGIKMSLAVNIIQFLKNLSQLAFNVCFVLSFTHILTAWEKTRWTIPLATLVCVLSKIKKQILVLLNHLGFMSQGKCSPTFFFII